MRLVWLGGCVGLLLNLGLARAQNSIHRDTSESSRSCATLTQGKNELLPLVRLCEFVQSLRHSLPNFVCEQTITRSTRSETGHVVATDVVKSSVTYEDGREKYGDVTVNGRAAGQEVSVISGGASTFGEFGSLLISVFSPVSKAQFSSRADEPLASGTAMVFDFHIKRENNKWWVLRDSGMEAYPELRGSVWVDKATLRLFSVHLSAVNIPENFPEASVSVTTEYADVTIPDVGTFLLPTTSEWLSCLRPIPVPKRVRKSRRPAVQIPTCMHNEVVFHDYRKFAAKSRVLTHPDDNQSHK